MYKIIGADQKEYGPVTAEQIREWLASGRANANTQVQVEGGSDWVPLGNIPELAPPPLSPLVPAAKTSGLAVTSLVLGILGLITCGITALFGLVLGIIALLKINKSQGALKGSGLAIAGICVSGAFLLLIPIQAALLIPALSQAKTKAQSINCMNNERQLCLGLIMYASDNKEQFPPANRWCDSIMTYVGNNTNVFHCPGLTIRGSAYAFNAKLNGKDNKLEEPAKTVLIFESNLGWNGAGGKTDLATRHRGGPIIGFADGHTEVVRPDRLDSLRWDP